VYFGLALASLRIFFVLWKYFAWDLLRICLGFAWDLLGIYLGFVWDLLQASNS
jgi:hypothetical protein